MSCPVCNGPLRLVSVERSCLLGVLYQDEAARIAQRTGVIPGTSPTRQPRERILPMLARLLTGNEIMREVCMEPRQRPALGRSLTSATQQVLQAESDSVMAGGADP